MMAKNLAVTFYPDHPQVMNLSKKEQQQA